MTIVFSGAIVPRTRQYGAGDTGDAPVFAGTIVADVMVTGASGTPARSRCVTPAQSMTGRMAGRFARPPAAIAPSLSGRMADRIAAAHATTCGRQRPMALLRLLAEDCTALLNTVISSFRYVCTGRVSR